eukprot:m.253897 g.253897  ORF g.253897 m.253897 type:complete len:217 (+) comp40375_c1_seq27:1297-1947(+)
MIDATDHYFFSCDKKFVLDFHEEVDTGSDAALIAVAVFFKHTCLYCTFYKSKSRKDFQNCLKAATSQSGGSNLYYALNTSVSIFTRSLYGERKTAENMVFFLTSGRKNFVNPYRDPGYSRANRISRSWMEKLDDHYGAKAKNAAKDLKKIADVHAVGIGRDCQPTYLRTYVVSNGQLWRPDGVKEMSRLAVYLAKKEVCLYERPSLYKDDDDENDG